MSTVGITQVLRVGRLHTHMYHTDRWSSHLRLGTNIALLSKNVKVNHISLVNRRWFKKMASPAPITKLFAMCLINAQKVMTLSGYWLIFEVS